MAEQPRTIFLFTIIQNVYIMAIVWYDFNMNTFFKVEISIPGVCELLARLQQRLKKEMTAMAFNIPTLDTATVKSSVPFE